MMNDATPQAGELFVTQFLIVSDQRGTKFVPTSAIRTVISSR
jgi:hypothetical protein